PYTVERLLAHSGTGPLYLGRAPSGRLVVVKVIDADFARDRDFRRGLYSDVERRRAAQPAGTVEILDVDTDEYPCFLVAEYGDAPTLAAMVAAGGPMPPADVHRLAVALASALAGLHDSGIVLGDLKPPNVVLSAQGLRLLDLGISRVLNGLTAGHRGGRASG